MTASPGGAAWEEEINAEGAETQSTRRGQEWRSRGRRARTRREEARWRGGAFL